MNNDISCLLSHPYIFISVSCLIVLTGKSSAMLNEGYAKGHFCIISVLSGELHRFTIKYAIWYRTFVDSLHQVKMFLSTGRCWQILSYIFITFVTHLKNPFWEPLLLRVVIPLTINTTNWPIILIIWILLVSFVLWFLFFLLCLLLVSHDFFLTLKFSLLLACYLYIILFF